MTEQSGHRSLGTHSDIVMPGVHMERSMSGSIVGAAPSVPAHHAALYLRVSTEDQDLEGQERELREYCAREQIEVVRVYREKRSAWSGRSRPDYEAMLRDVRAGSRLFEVVVVWSLDRFSRERRYDRALAAIFDLESQGVRFAAYKEPYLNTPVKGDPNSEMVRNMLLAIFSAIAGWESTRRSDRVRVALREISDGRRKTRSGRSIGRPRRLTREKMDEAFRLRDLGWTWKQIARKVGLPAGTLCAAAAKVRRGHVNAQGFPLTPRSTQREVPLPNRPSTQPSGTRGADPGDSN